MITYYAQFEPDRRAGGFVVRFPDFGRGVTQGENLVEARGMAEDLLLCLLEEAIRRGEALPPPTKHRGKHFRPVTLGALASIKVGLYTAFRASGLKKSEFARRIGIAKTNVERLFDLSHASRLEHVEAALEVLGKRLDIVVRDAA